ncbi:MAG: YcgN family cysteine cluster protein [Methyloligellaceae bacterium]
MAGTQEAFWRTKKLHELSEREWESLCDRCGQCCLLKLEDEDTGELYHTRLACRLLDLGACRCTAYANRHALVPDCAAISPQTVRSLHWLPATCAYRLVAEGRDLAWWHPLVSGSYETVHEAGISIRGWARSETGVAEELIDRYVIRDPSRAGQGRRR